jgi:hypothetical protein
VTHAATAEAWALSASIESVSWAADPSALPAVFRNFDLCVAHAVYLDAIAEYLERGGQSRGSYLVLNSDGPPAIATDGQAYRFALETPGAFVNQHILEIAMADKQATQKAWVPVRPVPQPDTWYESVWKAFRDRRTFDEMEEPT